jgi:hypothetical protein
VDGPTFKIERILKGGQRTDRFDVDAKLVADKDEPAQISGIQVLSVALGALAGPAISRLAKLSAAEPRDFGQSGDVLNARGIRAARGGKWHATSVNTNKGMLILRQAAKTVARQVPAIGRLIKQRDELLIDVERLRHQLAKEESSATFDFGGLCGLSPVTDSWGFARGQPVDRVYIERFLSQHRGDICGHVLEVEEF